MAEKNSSQVRFTALIEKANMHPNKLDESEMRELASLIPDFMHSMPQDKKQKWFDSFSNHTFIEFLMNWYQPTTHEVDSKEVFAFGELCRQAYDCGALYRVLGRLTLRNDALAALQVEVQAEIEDTLKRSFFDKLFGKGPTARIRLDQTRFTSNVSTENRIKLDNLIAEALLDVICKCEDHPGSKEIRAFPLLSEIRDDAKLSILRALEVSHDMKELLFPIAKSCRKMEEREKHKLLHKLEKASIERKDFFEEAKKKGITIPVEYYQESSEQLQKAKNVLEQAKTKGIDVTFAYDMVALNLADEKNFEAYLLAKEFRKSHHELSWMKVSLSFDAAAKEKMSRFKELEEANTLFSKTPTISLLEELNRHVESLRELTITPMSLWNVVDEISGFLPNATKEAFVNRLNACKSAHDPNDVIRFQKLQADIYSTLQSDKSWQKSPAVTAFIEKYENEVLEPKLVLLEGVYKEMPISIFEESRAEIMQKIEQAKRHENVKANIEQIETALRDALNIAVKKDDKFLAAHAACKQFQEQFLEHAGSRK